MTSGNRFTYDVVANDKATEINKEIRASIQALVPALEAAASAYERMAVAQNKLGLKSASGNQAALTRQQAQAQSELARNADAAARAETARAAKANSEMQARANLVARSGQQEAAALRNLQSAHERTTAMLQRQAALQESTSAGRRAALEQEIARSKALIGIKQQEVQEAQRLATLQQRANITGTGSSRGTGAGDARASAAAVTNLQQAHQRLAAAQGDVSKATALLTAEIGRENQALGRNAAQLQENEIRLNTTRYALYQVGAAYAAVARASAAAAKDIVGTAVSFESAFAQVARTTELGQQVRAGSEEARSQLNLLRTDLLEMSTQIPVAFEDLSKIGSLGAQLGIAAEDVGGFSETVAKFSATTNVTAEQSAMYFGRLQNILDVPTAKFKNLASAVSKLGTDSVATEDEILAVTTQIGAMATNAGFSAQYVVGLGTALASVRVAPELARGTTTRIFQGITRAAADGGPVLGAYARVLGTTSEAAAQLWQTNPEEFFSRFITSLGQASDAGQNLTPILDDLGIKGARDVPVITRLAGSYKLLGDYVDKSASAFQQGTYLDESFQTIAETTQAAITEMINSFKLFENSVGKAFLAPIKGVADALNGLFTWLSKLPSAIIAPIVGFVAAAAVILAYKAAMAVSVAAMLAFRAASRNLDGGVINTRTLLKLLTDATATQAGASNVAAASTGRHAAAVGVLAAAATRAAAPVGVLSTEVAVQAATAPAAAAGLTAAAGATNAVAAGSVRAAGGLGLMAGAWRAVNTAIGPIGWAFLAAGALVGLFAGISSGLKDEANAAAEAAAAQKALNASWQAAGAGADELAKAIQTDTKAYDDAKASGKEAAGVYELINNHIQTLSDGTTQTTTTLDDLRTGMSRTLTPVADVADAYVGFRNEMAAATGQVPATVDGLKTVTAGVTDQTTALGAATAAWKTKALNDKLNEALNTDDMRAALRGLGGSKVLVDAIKASFEGGPEAVTKYFGATTDVLKVKIDELQAVVDAAKKKNIEGNPLGLQFADTAELKVAEARLKALQDEWTLIGTLTQKFAEADTAIEAAAIQGQIADAIHGAMGEITGDFDTGTTAADEFAAAVQKAGEDYQANIAAYFNQSDLTGNLVNAFEALGESIADNGISFSNFTDAGRANLSALQGALEAFAATQSDAISRGEITAEQAAINTAQFIKDTMAELASQGVDMSQLEFLNQYLIQLTGIPWNVTVTANTSQAIAALEHVQWVANWTANMMSKALGWTVTAPKVGPKTSAPVKANVPSPMLGASLGNARAAQEAKNLAAAQDKAGGAAKKAGGAAKKAADDASEALKKQQQYVKDLASFYDKLGSAIFAQVNAEGDAFESLQKLGQSLVDNGKHFNTITDLGRKNFDALSRVFDGFGGALSEQIKQGVLNAGQAAAQYREFARGVYGELVGLGVSAQEVSGFFRGLGVDATGWTGNSGSVQQYAGFITAAADAAGGLSQNLEEAKKYSDELGTALNSAFDRYFGLSSAVDQVQSALNDLRKAYQDNIDKVKELRDANAGLAGDLSSAQSDKAKADIEQAISTKYGETDRATDYGGQSMAAGAKISDIQSKIDANNKEISTLESGRNALDGFSDAAIGNRAALQGLQKQMLDQIQAYAAAGHTTQEVTAYTEDLRNQFTKTALEAGYTSQQIVAYTGVFQNYVAVIRSVPDHITTIATADTSSAMSALNAIPRGINSITYAFADMNFVNATKSVLNSIPKSADYVVTPRADTGAAGAAGSAAGGAFGSSFHNTLEESMRRTFNILGGIMQMFMRSINPNYVFPRFVEGGWVGNFATSGLASGGFVPGRPPKDKKKDNLLAQGPSGLLGIQSGEYVIQQQVVNKFGVPFFDKLNNGELPGFSRGGTTSSSSSMGSVVAELSPDDRMLLRKIADSGKHIELYSDDKRIATSVNAGNRRLARRGA